MAHEPENEQGLLGHLTYLQQLFIAFYTPQIAEGDDFFRRGSYCTKLCCSVFSFYYNTDMSIVGGVEI